MSATSGDPTKKDPPKKVWEVQFKTCPFSQYTSYEKKGDQKLCSDNCALFDPDYHQCILYQSQRHLGGFLRVFADILQIWQKDGVMTKKKMVEPPELKELLKEYRNDKKKAKEEGYF